MIYLTVKEVAELKCFTQRYVKMLVADGNIKSVETVNSNNRKKYLIPISELSTHEQLKYYKSHNIEIPEELLAGRKPKAQHPHKEFDEFTAEQREEIAEWIRIINAWDEYCAKSKLQKVPATEKFVQLQKIANPELNISKGILYRKKAALKADDLAGLIDNRGSWKKGTSSIPDVAWECFLYFYLDEAQHPINACIDYTRMWLEDKAPQYLPLPDYSSFYRKVQTAIPKPLEIMGREGMKAFQDRCGTYIRRTYEGNGCNMTVHRDYATKSCPGDYLYNRMGDIASKVNKKLGSSATNSESEENTMEAKLNDKNNFVWVVKKDLILLKRLGVITQGVDDNYMFGNGTLEAIKQVQKKAGIKVDGICGTETVKAIGKLLSDAVSKTNSAELNKYKTALSTANTKISNAKKALA